MAQASRDENRIPTLLGVSSADGTTPVKLFADPTTHRLYVDLAAGGTTTVDAGTTTTLAPGASATVVNSGTTTDAVFDFGIPAGEKGDPGDPGDPGATGPVGMVWKDAYVGATAYVVNDAVSYNGSSYICILNSTGNLPTNTTYWSLVAQKGSDGLGAGDMLASVYDPTNVAGDAFDMDNMVEGTNNKLVSAAEKSGWSGKQDALGFTPENVSNKSTDIATDGASDTKYGSAKAIKTYADNKVEDSIVDGHTTIAPSGNAVFDALALKAPLASPTFTGTVTLPTTQLGESSIKLDASLSADEKWSGITVAGTAGATIAVGDVCYLASTGKWLLNDGILDGTDTGFSKQLGICLLAANDTDATEILLYGKVRSAAFPAFTVGSPVFLDDTAGDLTVTSPSTTNFAVRIVGFALSAEELMFNPSNDWVVNK